MLKISRITKYNWICSQWCLFRRNQKSNETNFIEFLDKYINNQNTIKKQASKINATKDQLILEFEKYIQTLSVDEMK